ncbi:MAG TPA: hypothetical protein PLZ16_12240, partial [Gammaproteobacteria bacterium]|nr:hypothetical protein [Gammaproteobacteria bacterium]
MAAGIAKRCWQLPAGPAEKIVPPLIHGFAQEHSYLMEIDSGAKTFIRFTGVNRRSLASWTGTLGLAGVALGLGASTAAVNIGILLLLLGAVLVLDDIVDSIGIGNALLAAALTAFLLFVTLWAIYHFGIDAHA